MRETTSPLPAREITAERERRRARRHARLCAAGDWISNAGELVVTAVGVVVGIVFLLAACVALLIGLLWLVGEMGAWFR